MSITVDEMPATFKRSRGARPECRQSYKVVSTNAETREDLYDELILYVPFIKDALYLSALEFEERRDLPSRPAEKVYQANCTWSINPLPSDKSPVRFRGSTRGGRAKIYRSFETLGRYVKAGQTAIDFGGLLEVKDGKPEGVDVYTPHLEFSCEVYLPKVLFTKSYVRKIYQNTPSVNDVPFGVFDPGECLFIGADWDYTSNPEAATEYVHLTFSFLGSANEQIIIPSVVGTGTNGAVIKPGWAHIWKLYAEVLDQQTGTTNFVSQVNVERIYPFFDPKKLGITLTP